MPLNLKILDLNLAGLTRDALRDLAREYGVREWHCYSKAELRVELEAIRRRVRYLAGAADAGDQVGG